MYLYKIKKESQVADYINQRGTIFVSKYSCSHSRLRKITRRMCKDGKITMKSMLKDGFIYCAI